MYKFRQFGRNEVKLLWTFARKRAKFSSGFRSNCLLRCQNGGCGLLPRYLPRNVPCVSDIDASEYSEELRKRYVPVLLSGGLALILAFCSERPQGSFDDTVGDYNFRSCLLLQLVYDVEYSVTCVQHICFQWYEKVKCSLRFGRIRSH